MIKIILPLYGLDPAQYQVCAYGNGLINSTWKLTGNEKSFILQKVNEQVFTSPDAIAHNLEVISKYLSQAHPQELLPLPLPALSGKFMVNVGGKYYRLIPFIAGSHTIDRISSPSQAFQAARQFGRFTNILSGLDTRRLRYTIPAFHDLPFRFSAFKDALKHTEKQYLDAAESAIKQAYQNKDILQQYEQLLENNILKTRVIHHDCKINNVLFDDSGRGLCVIDLDTVMPGFYLSDTGDLLRTCVATVSEEERDINKVDVRPDFFAAIYQGYMLEMGRVLSKEEADLFVYSGKMMIYMQALRFLTDYLNGSVYYRTTYKDQNLTRAGNQFALLAKYNEHEPQFLQLIAEASLTVQYHTF